MGGNPGGIMEKKYKLSLISYLNSRPFVYGLEHSVPGREMELFLDIPSKTAARLVSGEADAGLVPVGALTDLPEYHLVSDYCIGAVGPVRTVVLASEVPLEQIREVVLDYQSRSSVLLVRVLARHFWMKTWQWLPGSPGFERATIRGTTAGVVIGDRVFEAEKRFPFIYDLSAEWYRFTGLPFVFAVWVSCRALPVAFAGRLNAALSAGIGNIPQVEVMEKENYPGVDIFAYFTENISYALDEPKREGMRRFLELAAGLEQI